MPAHEMSVGSSATNRSATALDSDSLSARHRPHTAEPRAVLLQGERAHRRLLPPQRQPRRATALSRSRRWRRGVRAGGRRVRRVLAGRRRGLRRIGRARRLKTSLSLLRRRVFRPLLVNRCPPPRPASAACWRSGAARRRSVGRRESLRERARPVGLGRGASTLTTQSHSARGSRSWWRAPWRRGGKRGRRSDTD